MKNLVYNTPHGKLTAKTGGSVILEFENLLMQLDTNQFNEFRDFINKHIELSKVKNSTISNAELKSEKFYSMVISNMRNEYIEEFVKLINAPIYDPDGNFDIFNQLITMKTKRNELFERDLIQNVVKVRVENICCN